MTESGFANRLVFITLARQIKSINTRIAVVVAVAVILSAYLTPVANPNVFIHTFSVLAGLVVGVFCFYRQRQPLLGHGNSHAFG